MKRGKRKFHLPSAYVHFNAKLSRSQKCIVMFLFGGFGYGLIEILWRGRTHWSMVLCGGLCFLVMYLISGLPLLCIDETKRCFDIFVSLVAIIIFSPILLVTAIAIKLNDGGPVFYTQERLTKDGKIFRIHKFGSMRVDA